MGIGRAVSIVDPWRNIIYIINRSGDASLCSYKQDWRVVGIHRVGRSRVIMISLLKVYRVNGLSGRTGALSSVYPTVVELCTRENKWTTLRRELSAMILLDGPRVRVNVNTLRARNFCLATRSRLGKIDRPYIYIYMEHDRDYRFPIVFSNVQAFFLDVFIAGSSVSSTLDGRT